MNSEKLAIFDAELAQSAENEPILKTARDYNEAAAASHAIQKMPPIKTVGTQWYEYGQGAWRGTTHHLFRPVVLSILGEEIKSNRRCVEILKHIESQKQVPESELKSFYTLDSETVVLNVANGIVRVLPDRKVELSPHDPGLNFTRQLQAIYDPQARCPNFDRLLGEALPDIDDRNLLRLFVGSIFYPSCKYEAALVCFGPSGTGKSTVAESVVSILGTELVERIGMANICDPKGYYLPKLRHVAVNLGTELDALEVGESGNFKALVSGENIAVRPIYGAPFTMTTTAKLWFLSNNLPRFKHGTDAEQRRTRFLRFAKVPAVRDVDLKQTLIAERDGIFLWALEGLNQLLALKEMPLGGQESKRVHERFEITNDPLGAFVAARCRLDSQGQVRKDLFRNALIEFCQGNAIPCEDDTWLFRLLWSRYPELKESQVTQDKTRIRVIKGLVLV